MLKVGRLLRFASSGRGQVIILIGLLLGWLVGVRFGLFNPWDRLVFENGGYGHILAGEVAGVRIGSDIKEVQDRFESQGFMYSDSTSAILRGMYLAGTHPRDRLKLTEDSKDDWYYCNTWRQGQYRLVSLDGKTVYAVSWSTCPLCP